jgi:CheY-like chemotaxis protein
MVVEFVAFTLTILHSSFSILDPKPRQDLSADERKTLKAFARLTVDALIKHRDLQQQKLQLEQVSKQLAFASQDLITPLTAVQHSLSLAKQSDQKRKSLYTISERSDISGTVRSGLQQDDIHIVGRKEQVAACCSSNSCSCNVAALISKINNVMSSTPRLVPVMISVDPQVPPTLNGVNELEILHMALQFLFYSCERTSAGSVRFTIRLEENQVVFDCQDPGPPLSPHDRHCFTETGLRLTTGEQTISNPQVESTTKGTRFWFALSLTKQPRPGMRKRQFSEVSQTSDISRSSTEDEHQRTTLVIDDSTVVRKLLARTLSQMGYETFQAANGMEGLRLMQARKFDLVLCDFLMPVMDGMDCVREYRQWEEEHRPVHQRQFICGMSAHASENDVERGLRLGMNTFKSKPVSVEHLQSLSSFCSQQQMAGRLEVGNANAPCPFPLSQASAQLSCKRVCLIATADQEIAGTIHDIAKEQGWQSVTTGNGDEALFLLKKRNWGAVVMDSDIPGLLGLTCITRFREWEKENRVHRQRHLHLMSSGLENTHLNSSMVLLPSGVDFSLGKPVHKEAVESFLRDSSSDSVLGFAAGDIISR